MTIRHLILTGLALLIAAPVSANPNSITGFQLPPSSDETPEVQGPVVEDEPAPTTPRNAPAREPEPAPEPQEDSSPRPAVTPQPKQTPRATQIPTPEVQVPAPVPQTQAQPPRSTPSPTQQSSEPATTAESNAASAPEQAPTTTEHEGTVEPAAPETAAAPAPEPAVNKEPGETAFWPWLIGFLVLVVGAAGGFVWWKRHSALRKPKRIEPPIVSPVAKPAPSQPIRQPEPPPVPVEPASSSEEIEKEDNTEASQQGPLRIALDVRELSLTLLNATLSYRLMLSNNGEGPLRDLALSGDLIAAHASLTREEQLASELHTMEELERIDYLAPGSNYVFNGEFRLPFGHIRPIRQGNASLFVPLARFRVSAEGLPKTLIQTSLVGLRPARSGGGLQPFRLDQGPRVYTELSQRAFA
ncbi:hypothetical protein D6851_10095 [Altericroceibacterium spongiae]|uniref:LPXTG cell wall anchor domain-containing protein n=1 Tax=Altericroceibacterium spongiae TaxID=2320269 RepID=A0A420EKW1_9SPHN|nr:hypothetical protein [Altericroceibacterium spongiae]RKF21244.1 hypothetical protein D6851_10095 [Altericroceibacterium spongiae]